RLLPMCIFVWSKTLPVEFGPCCSRKNPRAKNERVSGLSKNAARTFVGGAAMKEKSLRFGKGFRVAFGNRRSQAAEMVIAPGDSEGDPANRHSRADQWLFVLPTMATATSNHKRHRLHKNVLLLSQRTHPHEIRNK